MKEVCNSLQGLKPVIVMVFVQIAYAAMNIMCKLVINDGMSMRVATAYRLICASAFTIPVALFFDRRKRPKITWKVLFMAFLSGLFGLEKLNWSLAEGKAKVMGTAIGISGAMLMTFYNGAEINIRSSNINLLHAHQNQNGHMEPQHADFSNKLLGVLCAIGSSCFFSLWFIIQAKMNKEYPSHHSSTALMSTMGAIQAIVFAICVDRDLTQWKLGYNIRLLMVAYSGIVISGIATIVIAWCIKMRGPLFASVFYPLQLLLVAVSAYLLLDEKLYLGSILGAVLIVCGLYIVLWSKNKEMKEKVQVTSMAGPTYSEA
ncbi:putative EamA domain-containing protein [Medicago truncatula]|uniref:WAT1-related protein n=1 Tax=Medicago truncatula TaxID=3880 RepID=A0A396IET5_MEDTR|nr:WAT1-related protein At1g68170-like isoform X2 [Medicago truncatula]RHN62764.1 putative EamA domain-containing protein [Medicago truncatula]